MSKKIKKIIGIDARLYGTKNKGLGRYVQEIVDRVTAAGQGRRYIIFLSPDNFGSFQPAGANVAKVLVRARWYSLAEQFIMPWLIWRHRLDLIHVPHFNVPFFCPAKLVVTIHDLILTKFPSTRATTRSSIVYRFKNLSYRIIIKRAIKRAEQIIAVSEFTKADVVAQFGAKKEKISVSYEGIFDIVSLGLKNNDKNVLLSYNIHSPYILYVGNAYPHKNLDGLIRVFGQVESQISGLSLVLVGKKDYFYERLQEENKNKKIIFTGYVSDSGLVKIYRQALVYVFASKYEGFGLPPLEAMSQGCAVLSSNKASMPEILGEAAMYFDPNDEKEMAQKIVDICSSPEERQKLIAKGYEQIKKYSWSECAEITLRVYNKALNTPK